MISRDRWRWTQIITFFSPAKHCKFNNQEKNKTERNASMKYKPLYGNLILKNM